MSLEAIEKVTEVERKNKERRAAAETEAKQMLTSAQRDGLALLEQMRAEEAAKGAELLRQAESGRHSGLSRLPLLPRRMATPCAGRRRAGYRQPPSLLSEG